MMQHFSAGGVLCRVLGLALLGFVAVTTAGIVLPVLTFAVLGYGVYGVFSYLWTGKWPQGWERLPGFVKGAVKRTWQIIGWPVAQAYRLVVFMVGSVFRVSWSSLRLGWIVSLEVLADAILGAAAGVLIGIPLQADRTTVIAGGVMGGVIGLWYGVRKWWGPKKPEIVLTPLHVPVTGPAAPAPAMPRLVEC